MAKVKKIILIQVIALLIPPLSTAHPFSFLKEKHVIALGTLCAAGYLGKAYYTRRPSRFRASLSKQADLPHFSPTVFSHGLTDNAHQAHNYTHRILGEDTAAVTYDDGSSHRLGKYIYASRSTLGQSTEITKLNQCCKEFHQKYDSQKIVLMGVSRGASAIINLFAAQETTPERIGALVLESPFDDPLTIFKHFGSKAYLRAQSNNFYSRMGNLAFPRYNKEGERPIEAIKNIPHNLPVLIICTKQDTTVPYASSIALYEALKESGHPRAHLLVFKAGKHAKLISDPNNQATYQDCVHAFYKKYGLPHDAEAAQRGAPLLQAEYTGEDTPAPCQPASV